MLVLPGNAPLVIPPPVANAMAFGAAPAAPVVDDIPTQRAQGVAHSPNCNAARNGVDVLAKDIQHLDIGTG